MYLHMYVCVYIYTDIITHTSFFRQGYGHEDCSPHLSLSLSLSFSLSLSLSLSLSNQYLDLLETCLRPSLSRQPPGHRGAAEFVPVADLEIFVESPKDLRF